MAPVSGAISWTPLAAAASKKCSPRRCGNTCETSPPGRGAGEGRAGGGHLVGAARAQGGGRAATRHGGSARESARLPANPPSFPGPERARSRGPMGDRGLRRAEAGAASPPGFRGDRLGAFSCGNVQIRGCGRSARSARGGRPLPSRKDAPPRMRSLYRYTLCKRNIQQRADTARPPVVPVHTGASRGGREASALRVGLRKGLSAAGVRNSFLSAAGGVPFRIAGPAREELAQTSLERRRRSREAGALRARVSRGDATTDGAGDSSRASLVSITNALRQASVGE